MSTLQLPQLSQQEFPNERPKVLIPCTRVPQIALDLLTTKCDLVIVTKPHSRTAILGNVVGVDAILWSSRMRLDKTIIQQAGPSLKVVSTLSSGYSNVEVEELKTRGIKLGVAAGVDKEAVADVAVLLALAAGRRLNEGLQKIHQLSWEYDNNQWLLGQEITGSTVGIMGLGPVGLTILKRLQSFQVDKFLYHDEKELDPSHVVNAKFVTLEHLTKNSDFIFNTLQLTPSTFHLCDNYFFQSMKRTAVFINTGRGDVVDQDALIEALKTGEIFAAGLDVMSPEPLPENHPLLTLMNCVLMPHLGGATLRTRNAMAEVAAQNILLGLEGKEMVMPVVL